MIITLLSQYDHVLYYLSFLCLYYLHMIVSFNMSLFFLLLYLCTTSIWWCPLLCQIYQVKSQNREWIRSGHRPHNDHVVGASNFSMFLCMIMLYIFTLYPVLYTVYVTVDTKSNRALTCENLRRKLYIHQHTKSNIPNLYYKNTKSTLNLI